MSRVTLKSSTIFISVGNRTEVYRSVAEVPPSLRKKLEQSTNGINSATILIADRKGKEEIVRAIRGLPSNLRSKLSTSLREEAAPQAERKITRIPWAKWGLKWALVWQDWAEFLLPATVAAVVWMLFGVK